MRMKVCMGVGITNMCDMQLSNASNMYSSGSTSIAFGTAASALRLSGTGAGGSDCCCGCRLAFERGQALACTGSLDCFFDCELPLVGGPSLRGCNRRFSWHPADVDFRDPLDGRPSPVARGLLLGCTAGTGSVASVGGTVFC